MVEMATSQGMKVLILLQQAVTQTCLLNCTIITDNEIRNYSVTIDIEMSII